MRNYGLIFHHFGLAVNQPEKAKRFLQGLGYSIGDPVYDPLQKVNLIMCRSLDMPDVELIYSAESPGPLENLLRNSTEVIYHLCYETENLEESLQTIKDDNNRVITVSRPKQAVLFSYRKVSFYRIAGYGIIELIEKFS